MLSPFYLIGRGAAIKIVYNPFKIVYGGGGWHPQPIKAFGHPEGFL